MNMKGWPRQYWEDLLAEVESGQTVAEVAQRHGINKRALLWWYGTLRKERREQAPASRAKPRLLPVVVQDAKTKVDSTRTLLVEVNGVRVRVESGTEIEYVAALVRALRVC